MKTILNRYFLCSPLRASHRFHNKISDDLDGHLIIILCAKYDVFVSVWIGHTNSAKVSVCDCTWPTDQTSDLHIAVCEQDPDPRNFKVILHHWVLLLSPLPFPGEWGPMGLNLYPGLTTTLLHVTSPSLDVKCAWMLRPRVTSSPLGEGEEDDSSLSGRTMVVARRESTVFYHRTWSVLK